MSEKEEKALVQQVDDETVDQEQPVEDVELEEDQEVAEETQPDPQEVIAELQEQLKKAKNDIARAYADTENMKKRLKKEADSAKKYRFQQAGLEMLPILDNMKMALNTPSDNPELTNYVKGFEMIYQQMQRVLENEGVKEIEAEGKPFDHNTMQALMQEKAEDMESGMVIEVLQTGYMLKDRILRPALVKVSE
ncbi:MAG: nucleotide exchange factor GrpE [Erysipelotrichaceae bacterium]|nr:nucleotide exchange factor GrpE [Erysipelotrichaceae bacterium]